MDEEPDLGRRPKAAWCWQMPCLIALAAFHLRPALGTGYWAEDVLFSLIPGELATLGLSISEKAWAASARMLREGRFYPVTPLLQTVTFHVVRDVVAYKAYLVAATIVDVLLFYTLALRLSGRPGFAMVASCLLIGLFQFRVYPDPILAYYAQVQLVAGLTLGSMLMLLRHFEGRGVGWLIGSAIAYLLSALTYEACYLLVAVPLFLVVRLGQGVRTRVLAAAPFVIAVGACSATTLVVRHCFRTEGYYIHHVDLALLPALKALLYQVSGALPLGYFLGDPLGLFPGFGEPAALAGWVARPSVGLVAAAGLIGCAIGLRRGGEQGPGPGTGRAWLVTTAGVGVMLAVLPAALLSLSAYHRQSFAPGVAWVPVFVQYLGVALLLASALWAALSGRIGGGAFTRRKRLATSALVAALLGVCHRANEVAAIAFNAPPGTRHATQLAADHIACWHFHRLNVEAALAAGLLDEVPERAALRLHNEYPVWHSAELGPWFYRMHTGKTVATYPPSSLARGQEPDPGAAQYGLRDVCLGRRAGFVLLSSDGPGAGPGRLYVRHPHLFRNGQIPALLLSGTAPGGGRRLRAGRDLRVIRRGNDWALFAVDEDAFAPDSLALEFDPSAAQGLIRSAATDWSDAGPRPVSLR